MITQDFETWFEEVKMCAIQDFGYSQIEASNFNRKDWELHYENGMLPFESVMQNLKKLFTIQNG